MHTGIQIAKVQTGKVRVVRPTLMETQTSNAQMARLLGFLGMLMEIPIGKNRTVDHRDLQRTPMGTQTNKILTGAQQGFPETHMEIQIFSDPMAALHAVQGTRMAIRTVIDEQLSSARILESRRSRGSAQKRAVPQFER